MNDVFYRSLKLKTGETITCGLHKDYKLEDISSMKFIVLIDPVVYDNFRFMDPKIDQVVDATTMVPFNMTTNDHEITIYADQVVAISSLRKQVTDRYKRFVSHLEAFNTAGDIILNNQPDQGERDMKEELEFQSLLNMPIPDVAH